LVTSKRRQMKLVDDDHPMSGRQTKRQRVLLLQSTKAMVLS